MHYQQQCLSFLVCLPRNRSRGLTDAEPSGLGARLALAGRVRHAPVRHPPVRHAPVGQTAVRRVRRQRRRGLRRAGLLGAAGAAAITETSTETN